MVKLARIFHHLQPFKALVLGDFLLDTYTIGKVKRISPEAPVPIMEVIKHESRPGGAGNVVSNLTALGATVFAVGRIGDDREGKELKSHLHPAETTALFVETNHRTPVKNRLIADSQQLIRVDFETISPLCPNIEAQVLEYLTQLIPQVQVVALSDYGKGFLTTKLIAAVMKMAKEAGIPTIVDPKGTDFSKYQGATVLKPNLSEAYAAAQCLSSCPLEEVAKKLSFIAGTLMITRSEAGISLFDVTGKRSDFPVRSKEVKDVTGAGDTVLSMLCLGLANGLNIYLAAKLANIAASLSVERLGCVQITLSEIAARLLEYDCTTKMFDESHTYALHQVLKGKKYSLLVLEKGQSMTNALFRSIRELSDLDKQLIVYVRGCNQSDELPNFLSSLREVNYIILETESLKNLCLAIHPHAVYMLEKDRLVCVDEAKQLLDSLICQSV